MKEAGYEKDGEGFWAKDGARLQPEFHCACWLGPMGPVVEKRLRDAGFDVTVKLVTTTCDPFFETVRTGNADMWIIVHCGSSREPWGTLQHYHSKFNSPERGGKTNNYIWANSQYKNPDYDTIINQLDGIPPSPTDPKYTDLVRQAVEIYLRDVVEITMSEERHVRTYNYHWKGWPNADDPYVAPYALWASIMTALLKVDQAGAGSP